MAKHIEQALGTVEIPEDPEFANSLGYAMMAQAALEKAHART